MKTMKKNILLSLLGCVVLFVGVASSADTNLLKVSPKFCKQGLSQPKHGDFAVFVFCDDALGTQIGVILTRPGVGPFAMKTEWSLTNRFWQEGPWMRDVKEMVWSRSGNYLYVLTSEVYSEEALYELDLKQRKAHKLLDGKKIKGTLFIERLFDGTLVVNGVKFKMKN